MVGERGEREGEGGKRGEERAHTRKHRRKGRDFAAVKITEGEVKYSIS